MDVGGDVYDFLELADGRLAVVLGDVTGHGIDAAADMAMAKFVFRSLAREHSEPSEFLAAANEIVRRGDRRREVHHDALRDRRRPRGRARLRERRPPAAADRARGRPSSRSACAASRSGSQAIRSYDVERVQLEPGDAAVLFTDGVLEARRDGELYGEERLDASLGRHAGLPAEELANALVEDCRAFGGDLADDCAVVVLKRT